MRWILCNTGEFIRFVWFLILVLGEIYTDDETHKRPRLKQKQKYICNGRL